MYGVELVAQFTFDSDREMLNEVGSHKSQSIRKNASISIVHLPGASSAYQKAQIPSVLQ
jgi:hypothetical protein